MANIPQPNPVVGQNTNLNAPYGRPQHAMYPMQPQGVSQQQAAYPPQAVQSQQAVYPPQAYGIQQEPYPMQQQQPYPMQQPYYACSPYPPPNVYGNNNRPSLGKTGSNETAAAYNVETDRNSVRQNSSSTKLSSDLSTSIRHGFIRKVMAILALQLLITFGIAALFSLVPTLENFLLKYPWILIASMVTAMVLQITLVCVPSLGYKVPLNFFILSALTGCYSMLVAYGAVAASKFAFLLAVIITFTLVLALMIFAFQTKYDFTGMGAYLLVAALVLFIFGLVSIFVRDRIVDIVYSSLSALIFSCFLVYHTQLVVGGKQKKYEFSVDDYIFAALTLYLDIIIIFMDILMLTDR